MEVHPLNVGVIGLGVGESHIGGYEEHSGCRVVKLCDFDQAIAKAAQKKYPDKLVVKDADEILSDPDIDIVSIATYDDAHYDQIVKGIRNGKHLFIEKPLVTTAEQAQVVWGMLEEQPEIIISSNLIMRKIQRFSDLKNRIDNGEFGDLSFINTSYNYGRLNRITDGWRGRAENYSIVTGGGIHMIDLLLWLTNDYVEEVVAVGNKVHTRGSSFKPYDLITSTFKFKSGLIANVICNFGCVMPHYHQLEVFGTKQTFINSMEDATLYTKRDVKNGDFNYLLSKPDFPEYDGEVKLKTSYGTINKKEHIYEFVNSIVNATTPKIDKDQIFKSMAVCFAIERSVRTGKSEKVTYYNI